MCFGAKYVSDGTGQEVTRGQLDAWFTRDSYWRLVPERSNNTNLQLHLNMVGNMDDLDF